MFRKLGNYKVSERKESSMNSKLGAALKAAVIIFVVNILLSVLMRFGGGAIAQAGGCLTCLLALGAGFLAVKFYAGKSLAAPTVGDGATLGALSGVMFSTLTALVVLPFIFISSGRFYSELAARLEGSNLTPQTFTFALILAFLIVFVVFALASTLGGVIGASIFGKNNNRTPPFTSDAENTLNANPNQTPFDR